MTPASAGPDTLAALASPLESAAQALGIPLTPQQSRQLLDFLVLLERWNRTYNLTAIRALPAMLTQHVVDCLAAAAALQRRLGSAEVHILDVGSGGGLPGVVLAIALPGTRVTCVDRVGKKAAFVQQVSGAVGLANLVSLHARVEDVTGGPFDVVASRAFGSLAELEAATSRLIAPRGLWMAMKGKPPKAELSELPRGLVFHVEPLEVPGLTAARCIVWLKHVDTDLYNK